MKLTRVVQAQATPDRVWAYLADFTTSREWDPGTVSTERVSGDGGVGTTYRNVSRFLGRESELTYQVTQSVPGRLVALVGHNRSLTAHDTMTIEPAGTGTQVTYEADFEFRGFAGFISPLLSPALKKLADDAQAGMSQALARL